MPLTNLRHLYRDRRRLALAALLLFATILLGHNTLPDIVPSVPTELFAVLAILVTIPLVTLFLPRYRHWIEISLIGIVAYMTIGRLWPASAFDYQGPMGFSVDSTLAFFGVLAATRWLIYGTWSDRYPLRRAVTTAKACTRLATRELWHGLMPTPGHLDGYPDPEVVSIDYADSRRRVVRLVTWAPPRPAGETLVFIDEIEPYRHASFRIRVVSGLGDPGLAGTTAFEITDCGGARRVTMQHARKSAAPRRLLRAWLDDSLGRLVDARLAAVERGHQRRLRGRGTPKALTAWYEEAVEVTAPPRLLSGSYRPAYGRQTSAREQEILAAMGR